MWEDSRGISSSSESLISQIVYNLQINKQRCCGGIFPFPIEQQFGNFLSHIGSKLEVSFIRETRFSISEIKHLQRSPVELQLSKCRLFLYMYSVFTNDMLAFLRLLAE